MLHLFCLSLKPLPRPCINRIFHDTNSMPNACAMFMVAMYEAKSGLRAKQLTTPKMNLAQQRFNADLRLAEPTSAFFPFDADRPLRFWFGFLYALVLSRMRREIGKRQKLVVLRMIEARMASLEAPYIFAELAKAIDCNLPYEVYVRQLRDGPMADLFARVMASEVMDLTV